MLIGRLGGDPIQRETQNGNPVVNFSLATSRRVRDQAENYVDETDWHKVVVWGRQGEACKQYLKKGQPVFVEGSLRSRQYTGKDGAARMAFEVYAESVSFLSTPGKMVTAVVDPVTDVTIQ
jgi:single-strand DNA-binding protein